MNIYEIAEKAGVSIATVSRVLNGGEKVSPKTAARIKGIIKEEGYRPNAFARGLTTASMRLVGVLCTDLRDSFYAEAVALLQAELRRRGFDTLLGCTGNEEEGICKQFSYMAAKQTDAVFAIGSGFLLAEGALKEAAKRAPLILINAKIEGENIYSVYCDEVDAVEGAVYRLLKSGAKSFCFLQNEDSAGGHRKEEGFFRGIAQGEIEPEKVRMLTVENSVEGGALAIEGLLREGFCPDAVLAAEDLIAIGAQKALLQKGLSRFVVGCDNSSLCECATPTLTSIDNHLEILCREAVAIMRAILKKETPPSEFVCHATLVLRESFSDEPKKKTVCDAF